MTVLIPAVNGRVASATARRLVADGVPVRALARDRGRAVAALALDTDAGLDGTLVDLRIGELDDLAFLGTAMRGVDVALLCLGTDPRQVQLERGFIEVAREAALPHLVKVSTMDVGSHSPNPVGRWHAEIEAHLAATGVPTTLLRPSYFTSNLLRTAAPSVAANGRWFGTSPTGRIAMIDPDDVAAVAAVMVRDRAPVSRVYELSGRQAVTLPEVAEVLSRLLDRPISYVPTTEDAMRAALRDRGVPDYYLDVALGIDASVESGCHERVTVTVEELTGRPPASVGEFLARHRDAFRTSP